VSKAGRTPLLIIFVTVFIDLLGFGIVLPLLPRYAASFHAGKWTLGMLMASFSAMQFVFAPIWGRLSDRIGRRPVLLIGLAGSSIFYTLFGYASSLGAEGQMLGMGVLSWLFISRIGAGIAGATIPTAQAFIADTTERGDRTKGMALIGAAFGVGFTFGPLIGAMFVPEDASDAPSSMPGYVAGILSAMAFAWAWLKLPESLRPGQSESAGRFHLKHLGLAFRTPAVGLVLLAVFMTVFAFSQFESTLALLTRLAFGLTDRENFEVFAYVGFVLTISQGFLIRRLATRIAPHRLALAGTAVMVVGLALVGWAGELRSKTLFYSLLPIAVVGFSATNPALQALLSLRTPADRQGEVLGVGQSMSALARILGPVAGMRLFDDAHVAWPYWFGAALMFGGLILVGMLRPKRHSDSMDEEASDSGSAPAAFPDENPS